MTGIDETLRRLVACGANISLDGEQLKIEAPQGLLNKQLLQRLKDGKEEAVRWTKAHARKGAGVRAEALDRKEAIGDAAKTISVFYRAGTRDKLANHPEVVAKVREVEAELHRVAASGTDEELRAAISMWVAWWGRAVSVAWDGQRKATSEVRQAVSERSAGSR